MYLKYPKLFGGNVGTNNFDALSTPFGIIVDGKLPDDATAGDVLCLLYRKSIMEGDVDVDVSELKLMIA